MGLFQNSKTSNIFVDVEYCSVIYYNYIIFIRNTAKGPGICNDLTFEKLHYILFLSKEMFGAYRVCKRTKGEKNHNKELKID